MIKKYLSFFALQFSANALWVFWALPSMGETGAVSDILKWLGVQILLPVFLSLLLSRRRKSAYWLVVLYGALFGLYALGMLGWSLIGEATPLPVYVVCALFFILAFGVMFQALKDLGIGQKARRYDEIKDE